MEGHKFSYTGSLVTEGQLLPTGFVQTDRESHNQWAQLCVSKPRAAAVMHVLASRVGDQNAVVVSHKVLAKLTKCSIMTVRRALDVLAAGNWIEIRQIGKAGSVNAYVLNDRVAWATSREGLRLSEFSASVIVEANDQPDNDKLGRQAKLKKFPEKVKYGEGGDVKARHPKANRDDVKSNHLPTADFEVRYTKTSTPFNF